MSSQPPFPVGSHNLHLEEGIAVVRAQNELCRSLDFSFIVVVYYESMKRKLI